MTKRIGRLQTPLLIGGTILWGLLLASCMTTNGSTQRQAISSGAGYVGSAKCSSCHDEIPGQFHDQTHARLVVADSKAFEQGCESCHGPAAEHVKSGGETGTIITGQNLCVRCHQDVEARFNLASHHPLKEGAVTCTSCHDAHGSKQATLTSTVETCTSCHQEARGPFAFEHAPAAENCTGCHNPHGSTQRSLLKMSEPMLCLQCHSLPNNRHGQTAATTNGSPITAAVLRNCSSCHSQVHGSSTDQHMRF